MDNFKPLLAATADLEAVTFPVLASPKLDGIRAFSGILPGLSSRTFKSIPNRHIQAWAAELPPYLDGELLTYTDGVRDDFNTVQSKIMSRTGTPEFKFHVFDHFADPAAPFHARLASAANTIYRCRSGLCNNRALALVPHAEMHGVADLAIYEQACVDGEGWEGIMIRHPDGRYKFGRSTAREATLLKVKRFEDAEAIIVGFQEEVALDGTKKDTLGALHVMWGEVDFSIGTGFTAADRADMWNNKDALLGQKTTFKFQGVGSLGRPRFPSFVGIRRDL